MPLLSFIVIAYNMQREVSRTLHTLSRDYQQGGDDVDYEIILVDNGSPTPFDATGINPGVPMKYIYREHASVSPADAINHGVAEATGDYVAVMIDGARMLSPGVVAGAAAAVATSACPVAAVLGLHLGPSHQRDSVSHGYSRDVEDQLLASIGWPDNGYRLFSISAWGGSCAGGWFDVAAESNCIIVSRDFFARLGGYDEAFRMPGGGLVNLDFYKRAVEAPESELIYLLGEGCFHQLHGGVTTSERSNAYTFAELDEEYTAIRGQPFSVPTIRPRLIGAIGPEHAPAVEMATRHLMKGQRRVEDACAPFLGANETS